MRKHCDEALSRDQIINRINTLVCINFMGVRLNGSPDIYAYDLQESNKLKSIISNTTLSSKVQFVIHPIFYRHLNIIYDKSRRVLDKIKSYFKYKSG